MEQHVRSIALRPLLPWRPGRGPRWRRAAAAAHGQHAAGVAANPAGRRRRLQLLTAHLQVKCSGRRAVCLVTHASAVPSELKNSLHAEDYFGPL